MACPGRRRVRRADALLELLDQASMGRAARRSASNQDPNSCRKIHWSTGSTAGRRWRGHDGGRVEPEPPESPPHGVDVLGGAHRRVLAGLDGVLLGGQAEGVEPEGMEDDVALHAPEPGVAVGGDVAERMPDMEAGARGIGEHVEHVAPIAARQIGRRRPAPRRGWGPRTSPAWPTALPSRLDVAGELGGVGGADRCVPRGDPSRRRH